MGVVVIKSLLFFYEYMIYYENKYFCDLLNNFSLVVLCFRLVNCIVFCFSICLKELWLCNFFVRYDLLILNCYFDICVCGEWFEIIGVCSGCFFFFLY